MTRNDISDQLIHFTKENESTGAFDVLKKIISDRTLLGNINYIKGQYRCVCFSEAPIESLHNGLVNPNYYSRYSPFGVMFKKQMLFEMGARPVIYQPDSEFGMLSETIRWRHVRYDPPEIDFSWEREWRIQTDELKFDSKTASIIVRDQSCADRLSNEHELLQDYMILQYSSIMNDDQARQYRAPYPWRIICLQ